MSSRAPDTTANRLLALLIISSIAGVAMVVWLAMHQPLSPDPARSAARPAETGERAAIVASLSAGGVTVERAFATVAFDVEPGEALDWRLPAGAFTGRFVVRTAAGRDGPAYVGAAIRGGQLIVYHRDKPIVTAYAGDDPQILLSKTPIYLPSAGSEFVYEFVADADRPSSMRAVWRPLDAEVPLPLPVNGPRLLATPMVAGAALVRQHHCARCHESDRPGLQAMLSASTPPSLEGIGAAASPAWLRVWLDAPTGMPDVLPQGPGRAGLIEDLTHFLAERGGPITPAGQQPLDPEQVERGTRLYADVGCVACHGALDGSQPGRANLLRPASKWTATALAAFLRDPLQLHPDGRMPDMALTDDEAMALAACLIDADRLANGLLPDPPFELDADRVVRGAAAFVEYGCARCHAIDDVAPGPAAAPLEAIAGAGAAGCLASERAAAPWFPLSGAARASIAAFLGETGSMQSFNAPHDRVAMDVQRLGCTSCHDLQSEPGPSRLARASFRTLGDADLGDEGRMPPNLTHVGGRLTLAWLQRVLDTGERARPYLATRMPRFGTANVDGLGAALAAFDGAEAVPGDEPEFTVAAADAGRVLVGAGGLNCIQCHRIAGREATGTPGPDLVTAVGRLRYPAFAAWVHDPALVRPGTRMPSFFVGGRSGLEDILDGSADAQVAAMWAYLSQGEQLPLPQGLVDTGGFDLDVVGRPVVFRTFMAGAGVRAIACGFPQQVHYAFDADACDVALAWTGQFLNARGAWAARGGSETNPGAITWTRGGATLTDVDGAAVDVRFAGYELDADGVPTFRYSVTSTSGRIDVADHTRPRRTADGLVLARRLRFTGPPGATLRVRGAECVLDADGRATVEFEITWQEDA